MSRIEKLIEWVVIPLLLMAAVALVVIAILAAYGETVFSRECNDRGGVWINHQCVHADGVRVEQPNAR